MTDPRNETHATSKYPPGRYGRRREPQPRRRWLVFALAGVVALAGLAIAWRLYTQYGPQDYEPQVQHFYNVTDDGVTIEFVVRKDPDKRATCSVRARAASGQEVGLAQVDVPPGAEAFVTYRLATSDRPVTAEVPACGPLQSR
ncbi:DUF4307 domain-containing protein [Dactylosporangium sp. NPDC000555]|uniref:DUF4307 domain-containing protein n=1 Tax=Dactylosporangium sp. NPDC000555 TaxID=3154260 RepID=UPI00332D4B71